MEHYLTKETCILEKKYYYVLLHWIQEWEEAFWNDARPEQQMLTDSARLSAGICLFKAINPIAASTLEQLFRQELAQANPMLAWNPDFATRELRETTENTLMEKLEADPELLFRTAPLLREQMEQCIQQFSEVLSEMLCRIYADRQELGNIFFGGKELGRILKIDGEQGDTHQRAVPPASSQSKRAAFYTNPMK